MKSKKHGLTPDGKMKAGNNDRLKIIDVQGCQDGVDIVLSDKPYHAEIELKEYLDTMKAIGYPRLIGREVKLRTNPARLVLIKEVKK